MRRWAEIDSELKEDSSGAQVRMVVSILCPLVGDDSRSGQMP